MQSTGLALSHTLISKQLKSNQSSQEVGFGMPRKIGQVQRIITLATLFSYKRGENNTQKSVITAISAISYAIRLKLSEAARRLKLMEVSRVSSGPAEVYPVTVPVRKCT